MKGVLLMGYGSPDTQDDVKAYFTSMRGNVPSDAEIESLKERYKKIGKSPLLEITLKQAKSLEKLLGKDYRVYVGMKHWKPYISESLKQMEKDGVTEAVAIAMTPYFSSMSVGSYINLVDGKSPIKMKFVKSWCGNEFFLHAAWEKLNAVNDGSPVIFTAHSLPEKILEIKDPYVDEIRETCAKLAAMAGIRKWRLAFQSAPQIKRERWIGPELKDVADDILEEHGSAIICPIGFVSDHLEVLFDIDIDLKEYVRGKGEIKRTESLNDSPLFIKALESVVRENLG